MGKRIYLLLAIAMWGIQVTNGAHAQYSILRQKPNTQAAKNIAKPAGVKAPETPAPAGLVAPVTQPNPTTLDGHYQALVARSRTSWGYKMIAPDRLNSFYRIVKDTLRIQQAKIRRLNDQVTKLKDSVSTLSKSVTGTEQSLTNANNKADEMSFLFGLNMRKRNYNILMFSLMGLLALGATLAVIRAIAAVKEALYRLQLHKEVTEEFQAFKQKANDKEKKLARELQDERNKNDALLKSRQA